jgi:5-methylcytosine-specific restriction endonuclease McrA
MAQETRWGIRPESSVLVLNATYEPINITSWKRAIVLLVKEKAKIISERVIRLVEYVRIPVSKMMEAKPSRSMIYKRDGHKCQYCGATRKLTIDHVLPKSKGGQDTWQNLVVACSRCNTLKSDKLLEHTGMRLLRKPAAPISKITFTISQTNDPEWQQYNYSLH